jgi:hypothetical protein
MIQSQVRLKVVASALALFLVLSGCNTRGVDSEIPSHSPSSSTTPAPTEPATATPSEDPGETILKQFQNLALASLPADQLYDSFKQMVGEVQPAQSDEIIRALEAYYKKNLPVLEKKYEDDKVQQELAALQWPIAEEQIAAIKNDSTRMMVQQTLDGGYKLETAEGFIFPIVDYGKLLSYGDKATTAMKTYLDLMATESDAATASDGGLVISWDELSTRTLAAESYVVTFPDSLERNKAEDRFINYLTMFLIGLDNTPIFDYHTFLLLPDVKSQYEQMVTSHAGTVTGQLTKQLLGIVSDSKGAVFIKGKNGEQTDVPAMKQFRDQLESTARTKLPPVVSG